MDSNSVAIVVFVGVELLLLAFAGWWVFRIFCPIDPDKTPKNFGAALRNIPFWCWWVVALGGLQVCTIGLHIPSPIPNVAFLASLPAFYAIRAVFLVFDKPIKKQSRNKTKKSSVKMMIVFVGLLFLVGAIWGLVSLHAWIIVFSVVAAFYILSYLTK